MSTNMTMNRVIHAAVRRDLARLESALRGVRDGDVARAGELARAYANLQRELTQHHEGEDRYVFPFLARVGVDAELLKAMDDEHQAMADALAETHTAVAAYGSSGSARDAERARVSVARTREVVDRHLDHEENDLEPLIRPHLQSAEWKTVEKQLRPRSLAVTGQFLAWIQDGMTDEGRTYLRGTIPPPVTAVLGRVAGRAYHRDVAPAWKN
ncbi:MAG TPA: hemerythrin domain-containing protein [Actinoplanes sp.]